MRGQISKEASKEPKPLNDHFFWPILYSWYKNCVQHMTAPDFPSFLHIFRWGDIWYIWHFLCTLIALNRVRCEISWKYCENLSGNMARNTWLIWPPKYQLALNQGPKTGRISTCQQGGAFLPKNVVLLWPFRTTHVNVIVLLVCLELIKSTRRVLVCLLPHEILAKLTSVWTAGQGKKRKKESILLT